MTITRNADGTYTAVMSESEIKTIHNAAFEAILSTEKDMRENDSPVRMGLIENRRGEYAAIYTATEI